MAKTSAGHIVVVTGWGKTDGLGFVCVCVSIVSTHGAIMHLVCSSFYEQKVFFKNNNT